MGCVETMKTFNKKELTKLLSYIVMGDGGLYISGECVNAAFAMNMRSANMDYILFCKDVLDNLVSATIKPRTMKDDGFNRQPQHRLQSRTHPMLTTLRDRIYTGAYKGIDPHALKLLDAQALAILYMCDGSLVVTPPGGKRGSVSPEYTVTLNMKRLSYGDQFILKKALKDNLNLEWNINRQNKFYCLRLRAKDVDAFMEMVAPHVMPSFQYKVKEGFRTVDPDTLLNVSGGDIVRASVEAEEPGRNDQAKEEAV